MEQGWMNTLEFGDVVGIDDIDGAEVFGAETGETLLGNRNADFFNAVDMGNFGENLFFFGVECEKRQIFCVEQA